MLPDVCLYLAGRADVKGSHIAQQNAILLLQRAALLGAHTGPCAFLLARTCAFMMRSMLADQPYSPVTSTQGESTIRSDTVTWASRRRNNVRVHAR